MKVTLILSIFCELSFGLIPPVRESLESIFAGRKALGGREWQLSHRVLAENQAFGVEERIVTDGNAAYFIWRLSNGQTVVAKWERQTYVFSPKFSIPAKTASFVRYLLTTSFEDYLRLLLLEGFVNKEQLVMFKEEYAPKGDPNTWKSRSLYNQHDGISLSRLPSGLSIAITGTEDAQMSKRVFLDEDLKGIARLYKRDALGEVYWDFSGFSKQALGGFFPKRLSFFEGNVEKVASTLNYAKPLKGQTAITEVKRLLQSQSAGVFPSDFEPVLKVLLSFR